MKFDSHKRYMTLAAMVGMVAVLVAVFIFLFRIEENKRLEKEGVALLESVTQSRLLLLTDLLHDETNDMVLISKNQDFTQLITNYVQGSVNESQLIKVFNQMKLEHGFAEVVFLNEKGEYILSTNPALTFNDSIDKTVFAQALSADSCYVTDIYRSSVDQAVYLDLVTVVRNPYGKPLGGLIFKMYAEETVDKILVDEGMSGYKSLVSLIREDAVNKWVGYKPVGANSTQSSIWQPLPEPYTNNPFQPRDKLVKLVNIDHTPWYLMVELDHSGRMSESLTFFHMTILVGVLAVLAFIVGLFLIVKRQEHHFTDTLVRKEKELKRFEKQSYMVMDLLAEAVIITDEQGLILHMNLAAELLSQYSLRDVKGKPLEKEIPLLQEESGLHLLSVKNWFSGERAYHQYLAAYLVTKDGSQSRVVCSLAPIESLDSEIQGLAVVLIKDEVKSVNNAPEPSERIISQLIEKKRQKRNKA